MGWRSPSSWPTQGWQRKAAAASANSVWNVTSSTVDWNAADPLLFDNGNARVKQNTDETSRIVVGVQAVGTKSITQFFFDGAPVNGDFGVVACRVGLSLNAAGGKNAGAIGIDDLSCSLQGTGVVRISNSSVKGAQAGLTFITNDYIDVVLDKTVKLAWYRKNGGAWFGDAASGTPDPVAGTGGQDVTVMVNQGQPIYPAALLLTPSTDAGGDKITLRTGSAFVGSAPPGYTVTP